MPGTVKYASPLLDWWKLTLFQIAELVAEYKELESPLPEDTPSRIPLLERNVNLNAVRQPRQEQIDHGYGEGAFEDLDLEGNDDQENINDADDSTSLSSYAPSSTDTLSTPTRKPTKAEIRNQKKAKKSTKSQNKALKNQSRHLASVTLADVEYVAEVLHGEEKDATLDGGAHPLATDTAIQDVIDRNLNFVKNIQAHKQYLFRTVANGRRENKEKKRLKKREGKGETMEETVEMDEVVSAIMIKLGISPAVVSASVSGSGSPSAVCTPLRGNNSLTCSNRKRASSSLSITPSPSPSSANGRGGAGGASRPALAIASKLRTAIKTDLDKHENEVHARYVRAGGFWRYVGKTVFERMTDVARDLDVSTGERWEKKRAREEREKAVDRANQDLADAEGLREAM